MSITFAIIDGPVVQKKERCFTCEQIRDFAEIDGEQVPEWGCCGRGCNGWLEYDEPQYNLNVNNGNAASIFKVLGIPRNEYDYGERPANAVGDFRLAIASAMESPDYRSSGVRKPTQSKDPYRGPRFFSGGLDDQGIVDRLEKLNEICMKAQELGKGIRWS